MKKEYPNIYLTLTLKFGRHTLHKTHVCHLISVYTLLFFALFLLLLSFDQAYCFLFLFSCLVLVLCNSEQCRVVIGYGMRQRGQSSDFDKLRC